MVNLSNSIGEDATHLTHAEPARIVTIYTKDGCHLCEIAKSVLLGVQERMPFVLNETDITTDKALHDKFKFEIPVILIDGKECFRHRLEEDQFVTALLGQTRKQ